MNLVFLEEIEPGMILAENLYSPTGEILLRSGIRLKQKYLSKLQKYGVYYVYVLQPDDVDNEESDKLKSDSPSYSDNLAEPVLS